MAHKTPNKKSKEPKTQEPSAILSDAYPPSTRILSLGPNGCLSPFPPADAGQRSFTKSPPSRTTNCSSRCSGTRLLSAQRPDSPPLTPGPARPGPRPVRPRPTCSAAFPTLPQGVKSRERGGVCCASPVRRAGRRLEASVARSGLRSRCVRRAPSRKRKPGGRAKGGTKSTAVNSFYRTAWLSPILAPLRLREMVRSGSRPGQVRAADIRRPFWGWKGTEGLLGW